MIESSLLRFDREFVLTMRSALDAAVQNISVAHRTPGTKAKMAQRIVKIASEGVTDSEELMIAAIDEGKEPAG
ncbi:hypothetical protein [Bradyrhizobium sp. dw_78]|uniref:hypothetical protein n=1 Tax=Bradyrhizobium sp. dw_78 TaxID=2719793 RepID=UPI001BD4DB80|nr:hypothetical protein [Bradyrhizobium sp. dw_78]